MYLYPVRWIMYRLRLYEKLNDYRHNYPLTPGKKRLGKAHINKEQFCSKMNVNCSFLLLSLSDVCKKNDGDKYLRQEKLIYSACTDIA